jgi:surface protein
MFEACSYLTTLVLNDFDTSNVTDMKKMFYSCSRLTSLDVSIIDTSNVTNMNSMFYDTSSLTSLDLGPNFNTSNVDNMSLMFYGDINLKKIYVPSSWSIAKLTSSGSGDYMFTNCYKLSGAISYDSTKTNKSYANYTTGYLTLRSS